MYSDTIAAVSTPRGKGGVAMIRISGSEVEAVVGKCFCFISGKYPSETPSRLSSYGRIVSPSGEVIDTGMVTLYRAPRSYTGEDMAEVTCHGGVSVTAAVLSAVLSAGARMAEAGEFTRRAFLNGKMTLTEAEAVGTLLDADTEERMRLASSALRGRLSKEIDAIADPLADVMTALYAAIDYPEEDVGDEGEEQIAGVIHGALERLGRLLSTYRRGKAVASGVRTVICGSPNSGKSSLYNLMSGDELAIVTDIPGTTRDVLRETVSFGGVTLRIADTAGLRVSSDAVEEIGVRLAEKEMERAELILAVFDTSRPLNETEKKMMEDYPLCPAVAVLNKTDLEGGMADGDEELIKKHHACSVRVSCADGSGLSELEEEIGRLYDSDTVSLTEDAVIWEARQEATLRRAHDFLCEAEKGLLRGDFTDAVCTLAEEALAELRGTDGRGVEDEIIDGIFSKFCVGK